MKFLIINPQSVKKISCTPFVTHYNLKTELIFNCVLYWDKIERNSW